MPYCPECSAKVPAGAAVCPTCDSALVSTPGREVAREDPDSPDLTAVRQELAASLTPQYKLLRLLGVGGMGAVYLAREPALKRLVAVKVLFPGLAAQPSARARFQREARAAAALSHPNVVRVYAVGETSQTTLPYIVMQYVEGVTLADWMGERRHRNERDVRRIIGQVAAALGAAHARELVHRDVKPANVLIERDSGRPYVADFGVSAALSRLQQDTKITATGMVLGTPTYMSPEQAAGEKVTPQSDVYSLGVVAYELLTGELPFTAASVMGWAAAHLRDTPPPVAARRPDVSPEVARLVDRCLAKKPADRPGPHEIARGMLPSLETEIEWPPPGLRRLQGRADVLLRLVLGTVAAGAFAVLAFAFTPDILVVHPHWLTRFDVAEQLAGQEHQLRATSPETGEVAFFAWQTVLWLASTVFGLGLVASLAAAWRTTLRIARARALGWSGRTLLDVAADHDGRSGLILAGTRELASLEDAQRARLLATRRALAVAVPGGGAWLLGSLCLWAVLAAAGPLGGDPTAPAGNVNVLLLLALPGLLGLGVGTTLRWQERRLLGPLARRARPSVGADHVAAWYDSLPAGELRPVEPLPERTLTRWRRATLGAATAVALGVTLAVSGLVVASVAAARFVQREAPRTAELLATLDRLGDADPLATARRVSQPYRRSPLPADDPVTLALVRSLGVVDPETSLPPYPLGLAPLRTLLDSLVQALTGGTADTVGADATDSAAPEARLEELGDHARTVAFRRLARAAGPDLLSAARDRPLDAYETLADVPILRLDRVIEAAHANAAAALAAAAGGDRVGPFERLADNLAMADRLLESSALIGNVAGLRMLQRSALLPLAALEERDGNTAQALALRDAARQLDAVSFPLSGTSGLAVDPANASAWRRVLANHAVPPGYRAELLVAAWAGLCGNRWELLGGPSARRRDTFLAIADSIADLPEARTLAEIIHRSWRGIEPRAVALEQGRRSRIQWTPWMVTYRLRLCAGAQ
jgi:serine/threonine-protein kinase